MASSPRTTATATSSSTAFTNAGIRDFEEGQRFSFEIEPNKRNRKTWRSKSSDCGVKTAQDERKTRENPSKSINLSENPGMIAQLELAESKAMKLTDRLITFMERYDLRRKEMSVILQTPPGTLIHWLRDEETPPGCLLALMDILEHSADARWIAGIPEHHQDETLKRAI
jgi:DNA-binding transcriptional regulator YiaG